MRYAKNGDPVNLSGETIPAKGCQGFGFGKCASMYAQNTHAISFRDSGDTGGPFLRLGGESGLESTRGGRSSCKGAVVVKVETMRLRAPS